MLEFLAAFFPNRVEVGATNDFMGSGAESLATPSADGFAVTGFAEGAEVVEMGQG